MNFGQQVQLDNDPNYQSATTSNWLDSMTDYFSRRRQLEEQQRQREAQMYAEAQAWNGRQKASVPTAAEANPASSDAGYWNAQNRDLQTVGSNQPTPQQLWGDQLSNQPLSPVQFGDLEDQFMHGGGAAPQQQTLGGVQNPGDQITAVLKDHPLASIGGQVVPGVGEAAKVANDQRAVDQLPATDPRKAEFGPVADMLSAAVANPGHTYTMAPAGAPLQGYDAPYLPVSGIGATPAMGAASVMPAVARDLLFDARNGQLEGPAQGRPQPAAVGSPGAAAPPQSTLHPQAIAAFGDALQGQQSQRAMQAASIYGAIVQGMAGPHSDFSQHEDWKAQFRRKFPEFANLPFQPMTTPQLQQLQVDMQKGKVQAQAKAAGVPPEAITFDAKGNPILMPGYAEHRLAANDQRKADAEAAAAEHKAREERFAAAMKMAPEEPKLDATAGAEARARFRQGQDARDNYINSIRQRYVAKEPNPFPDGADANAPKGSDLWAPFDQAIAGQKESEGNQKQANVDRHQSFLETEAQTHDANTATNTALHKQSVEQQGQLGQARLGQAQTQQQTEQARLEIERQKLSQGDQQFNARQKTQATITDQHQQQIESARALDQRKTTHEQYQVEYEQWNKEKPEKPESVSGIPPTPEAITKYYGELEDWKQQGKEIRKFYYPKDSQGATPARPGMGESAALRNGDADVQRAPTPADVERLFKTNKILVGQKFIGPDGQLHERKK